MRYVFTSKYILCLVFVRCVISQAPSTTKINVMQQCGTDKMSTCPFVVLSGTASTYENLFSADMCYGFVGNLGSDFSIRIQLDAIYKSFDFSFMIGLLDQCANSLSERTPMLSISLGININNTTLCNTYTYSSGDQGFCMLIRVLGFQLNI
jgi:hypothetical protein